ncbi:MAG: hypothetical protein DSM106950_35740 [Stigonema ocellatum SAG 48.90 = DSM 106950]|nr:hypothetical protein [Stigonema ocellatum SAG 48.90 = DSM 106950]
MRNLDSLRYLSTSLVGGLVGSAHPTIGISFLVFDFRNKVMVQDMSLLLSRWGRSQHMKETHFSPTPLHPHTPTPFN